MFLLDASPCETLSQLQHKSPSNGATERGVNMRELSRNRRSRRNGFQHLRHPWRRSREGRIFSRCCFCLFSHGRGEVLVVCCGSKHDLDPVFSHVFMELWHWDASPSFCRNIQTTEIHVLNSSPPKTKAGYVHVTKLKRWRKGREQLDGLAIQLMEQIRQTHQLRLAVYPIIYDGFYTSPGGAGSRSTVALDSAKMVTFNLFGHDIYICGVLVHIQMLVFFGCVTCVSIFILYTYSIYRHMYLIISNKTSKTETLLFQGIW